ncbi:MAG TPA: apolipoprotein N-acyltransferase [Candidatus Binataceae bacterium]|nr:apolipoprotein N-acyltransferase [Candidatus Binataceae bacterium]
MTSSNVLARAALASASGVALGLAFPKFDLNLLAWVALIPLLYAIEGRRLRGVFGYAMLQGFVFFVISLYWAIIPLHTFADAPLWMAVGPMLLLAAVEALFIAASIVAATFVTRRLRIPIVLTLPVAWTAVEWLRSWFPIGFPWNLMGYAAYRNLGLIQFAELTGVYGVSALIVLFNAVIYTVIAAPPSANRLKVRSLSALTALMVAAMAFSGLRLADLEHQSYDGALKFAMVQGNIPQSIKWNPNFRSSSFEVYVDQTLRAAKDHPDLIVWPEAAAAFYFQPDNVYPAGLSSDSKYRDLLLQLARKAGAPILFGAPAFHIGENEIDSFNRAYLVSADGQMVDYYDKMDLAPFAEYVPARKLFGFFVHKVVVGLGEFVPGQRQTLFDVKGAKLAVLICYEGIFPDLSARAVDHGANVLLNITNDAWYGNSSAPYQLLAMSALRSVETHTPMVRVANTGISTVITPEGKITARTDLFTRGTEVQTVHWRHARTVYALVGDLFAEICFGLSIIGLLWALLYPRRPEPEVPLKSSLVSANGRR